MAQSKQKKKQVRAKTPVNAMRTSNIDKELKKLGRKNSQLMRSKGYQDLMKEMEKMRDVKPAVMRKATKSSLAKRVLGKAGAAGTAAVVAHDVMRAGAKKGCIKRGGKWVSGKCQIAKKPRTKASGPDPRFSKTRGKK